ncbi:MAG: hypothetical protein K0B02_01395 [DPANN group archaeon]|nr:hypothetical protein [DPANN group archaeon]
MSETTTELVGTYLSQKEALNLFLPLIDADGVQYEKYIPVIAIVAKGGEKIITTTSDGIETQNVAKDGDYIVQNQTEAKEEYIVSADKFEARYEQITGEIAFENMTKSVLQNKYTIDDIKQTIDKFINYKDNIYQPIGEVNAVQIDENLMELIGYKDRESFHFEAPWGEEMIAKMGDFIVTPPTKDEVYRIALKEFNETYKPSV